MGKGTFSFGFFQLHLNACFSVLNGDPLLGRGVGRVRVDAGENHRRASGQRERGRLDGGRDDR